MKEEAAPAGTRTSGLTGQSYPWGGHQLTIADVSSVGDKLEALRKACVYAAERVAISRNLAAFPASADTQTSTRDQNSRVS